MRRALAIVLGTAVLLASAVGPATAAGRYSARCERSTGSVTATARWTGAKVAHLLFWWYPGPAQSSVDVETPKRGAGTAVSGADDSRTSVVVEFYDADWSQVGSTDPASC
jgi:hypothetical protein